LTELLKNSAKADTSGVAKRPVHQSVYEMLRDRVLFGDLAPGQSVTIQGLTEELGAGITPVREAIRRLISVGALKMLGNRRVIVPTMTRDDIEQIDFMRKSVEPELARRAVPKMQPGLLASLRATDNKLNTAIDQGNIGDYLRFNHMFHNSLYEAADAPILTATVDRLWLRFGPSLRVVCGRYGTMNLPDKHRDLLAALEIKDINAAGLAMQEDVHQGMMQIREALLDSESQ
jgi:DNA-binding GntR family transcriptional regulator